MEAFGFVGGLLLVAALLVLAVLAVLLPVFVANIASRTAKLVEHANSQTEALKAIQRTMENANTAQQMHGNKIGDELEANNALLRQLLRAYGHEPEN
jgi:predicted PurR-regulated permease PerM